jgi:hypothetical protein
MKTKIIIKILVSGLFTLLINSAFSITEIIRESLTPLIVGPFLQPISPLVILCFYIAEIAGVYGVLNKVLNRFIK